jgi:hypothetical protein
LVSIRVAETNVGKFQGRDAAVGGKNEVIVLNRRSDGLIQQGRVSSRLNPNLKRRTTVRDSEYAGVKV